MWYFKIDVFRAKTCLGCETFRTLFNVHCCAVVKKPANSWLSVEGHPVTVVGRLADIKAFVLI